MLEKLKDVRVFQIIGGAIVGFITFLLGLLAVSEHRRKSAQNKANKATQEKDLLKIERDVDGMDLDDVLDDDINSRSNKSQ